LPGVVGCDIVDKVGPSGCTCVRVIPARGAAAELVEPEAAPLVGAETALAVVEPVDPLEWLSLDRRPAGPGPAVESEVLAEPELWLELELPLEEPGLSVEPVLSPVELGLPEGPVIPVVAVFAVEPVLLPEPVLVEPTLEPPVEPVSWLVLVDDGDPPVCGGSACATADPLASAAPTPSVTAPAPSHVEASVRRCWAWCRPFLRLAWAFAALAFAGLVAARDGSVASKMFGQLDRSMSMVIVASGWVGRLDCVISRAQDHR
jgi:hypothetical protein